jgi:hypothetical protein
MSNTQQDALVQLLARIYTDILAIEEEFHLMAGQEDLRPRIEYFHDAVRAFFAHDQEARKDGGRLSVEMLAYDVSCLRYLCQMPLSPFKPHSENTSPHAGVADTNKSIAVKSKRPDRQVRERLADLYQHYSVLFSALLKPMADRDHKDRVSDLNYEVSQIKDAMQKLDAIDKGKGSVGQLSTAVQHLEEDELRHLMGTFIQQEKYKQKESIKKLMQFLKTHAAGKDKLIAAIDAAHMDYGLAQLGVYEESKDLIKKMAQQGMNLVGKFVQEAMAKTQREMGR